MTTVSLFNLGIYAALVYLSISVFVQGSENSKASLFTGEEELFAFERVKSRLTEMQTEDYWEMRDLVKEQRQKKGKKEKKAKKIEPQEAEKQAAAATL